MVGVCHAAKSSRIGPGYDRAWCSRWRSRAWEQHETAAAGEQSGLLLTFGANRCGRWAWVLTAEAVPRRCWCPCRAGLDQVTQIAAGVSHSLAVTTGGQLYAFGCDGSGQLGSPPDFYGGRPTPALVVLPGAVGDPISGRGAAQPGVDAQRSIVRFRLEPFRSAGQCGQRRHRERESDRADVVAGLAAWSRRSQPGEATGLVVTSDGRLSTPSATTDPASLGTREQRRRVRRGPTPTLVSIPGPAGGVTQIAAGGSHSLARPRAADRCTLRP